MVEEVAVEKADQEWRAWAIRLADIERSVRVTVMLCRRSGDALGFRWPVERPTWNGSRASGAHRMPPLPFHHASPRPGRCRVCGQPIHGRAGDHRPSRGKINERRTWHAACVDTFVLMTKPNVYARALLVRQRGRCAVSGEPMAIWPAGEVGEVDHEVPLYRVARDHADEPWHHLLRFWTLPNLRVLAPAAHAAKCAEEARERAGAIRARSR